MFINISFLYTMFVQYRNFSASYWYSSLCTCSIHRSVKRSLKIFMPHLIHVCVKTLFEHVHCMYILYCDIVGIYVVCIFSTAIKRNICCMYILYSDKVGLYAKILV